MNGVMGVSSKVSFVAFNSKGVNFYCLGLRVWICKLMVDI